MNRTKLTVAFDLLDHSGHMGRMTARVFDSMEWAEDEITKAQVRHPQHAVAINKAFIYLRPLQPMTEGVYRAHCAELLDRIAAGVTTEGKRQATNAELCLVFTSWSLQAPMAQDAVTAYRTCFIRAFGHDLAAEYRDIAYEDLDTYRQNEVDVFIDQARKQVGAPEWT